jgi:hypothetical protein
MMLRSDTPKGQALRHRTERPFEIASEIPLKFSLTTSQKIN